VSSVLVLNASYEPLSVVSVKRAIVLLLKEKAEIVEATQAVLRSEYRTFQMPLVIRLVYYVRIPHRLAIPISRRALLLRDHYVCQYCGTTPPRKDLTVDHVLPKSKGGKTTWDNVVIACKPCNSRKGNRTPTEANMTLLNPPRKPKYLAMAYITSAEARMAWEKYMWES
jgi:5-methylcytosine-specific restriction endonuclease McrA